MKFAYSLLLRLSVGLLLLVGLCLTLSVPVRPAHAQSTLTVTDCSSASQLQADVSQANTDNAGDTITFSCSGDIKLTSTLTITGSMSIDGSGQSVTLDGGNSLQVLSVNSGVSFTLNALVVAHGSTSGNGGGLANNGGTVSITNSAFTGNSSPINSSGGAIYNKGSLTISDSTFTGNSGYFGTVYNTSPGNVSITSSTFASNTPSYGGGGLYNDIGGTATIANSTIANNSGAYGAGLFDNFGTTTITSSTFANNTGYGFGGGIAIIGGSNANVNISGSIVANNSGGDCQNYGTLTDNGYNLDSDSSCFTSSTSLHTNPQLSGLADNGGPTQTMALQQGSSAIDVVPLNANICPGTDQRGDARPDADSPAETVCDMGAYESNYAPADNDLALTNMPANITTNATGPQGAVVTYTLPTVVDEDSPLPTASCTPASGSTFPIGTTTVTCTVTDSDDTNSPVSQSFTVTVNDTDLALSNVPANITTPATGPNGAVVTYQSPTVVDEESPLPPVSCNPASGSTFPIGTTTVTCTATDSDDTPGSVSASFTVTVSPVLTVSGESVSATEGSVFNGVVATGTAYGTTNPLTASITWGDGSSSTVSVTPRQDGSYSVAGSHTYAEEGNYTITVSVSDGKGLNASTMDTATVSDATLTLKQFAAGQVKHLTAGVAALFTDADPAGIASDYTAKVTWGDGTTSTLKVYKNPGGQGFVLAGSHSYAKKGTYSVTLTISDQGGSQIIKTANVTAR